MRAQKKRYTEPNVYRVVCRFGRWATKSERFYTAETPDEALNDFYLMFVSGKPHASSVKIHIIEKYDRFAEKWIDETHSIKKYPHVVDEHCTYMHVHKKTKKVTLRKR